jgi:putative membrane protein
MFVKILPRFRLLQARRQSPAAGQGRPELESLEERAAPANVGGNVSAVDVAYLTFSAQGDQEEIQIGTIAQHNSTNQAVQAFGQTLVTDHTNALQQEMPLLQEAGLTTPGLTPQQMQDIQSLQGLTGAAFDKQFADMMFSDHVQDIFVGWTEEVFGSNADVKSYAAQQIPILMSHLFTAVSIDFSLLGAQMASSGQNASGSGQAGFIGFGQTSPRPTGIGS